jgi:hypothetical protein
MKSRLVSGFRRVMVVMGMGSVIVATVSFDAASGKTWELSPGDCIQQTIDLADQGDTIVLRDGIYSGALHIDRSLTLKAEHGGAATVTNRFSGNVRWQEVPAGSGTWLAHGIDWPVHGMLVEGIHAFDYRNKANFDRRTVGPYWSKGWQEASYRYTKPPIYFAHDQSTSTLWLHLDDARNPNSLRIDFNSSDIDGETLVQKDLGTYWNQQEIVVVSSEPPVHPITMWYSGTPETPGSPRKIDFPRICGIVIDIDADDVILEGLRILMAPTVGVELNDSQNVTIRDCYFSGYQFAINTGYKCTRLTVEHCEMDGAEMLSFGGHDDVTNHMWNHSTYVNPIKFNGTGLTFKHNYVYEGYDLFQPRGRHKNYPQVPNLRSEVAYNVWHRALDNALEFDGIEAKMNLRFHHNLILQDHDALAITTTEDGGPLTIDHNLWWPGGGRIMKLVGTGRTNRGVQFVHNTYFTGPRCSHNTFADSIFENNIVLSAAQQNGCWTRKRLGTFFPTRYNLLEKGHRYTSGFEGLTGDPQLGSTPETIFLLMPSSPAIDAGRTTSAYPQENVKDAKPDLGAIEFGETIEDWHNRFGHVGPRWIRKGEASQKAPHRPSWPEALDPRWGGLGR